MKPASRLIDRYVGKKLPSTLVFVPTRAFAARYLKRYAPAAGGWGDRWEFDGISLGAGRVVWAATELVTRPGRTAHEAGTPPTQVGLLLAHGAKFIPEGVHRMAQAQEADVDWLMDVLGVKFFPRPADLGLKSHGSFLGFNYRGTPWVPQP